MSSRDVVTVSFQQFLLAFYHDPILRFGANFGLWVLMWSLHSSLVEKLFEQRGHGYFAMSTFELLPFFSLAKVADSLSMPGCTFLLCFSNSFRDPNPTTAAGQSSSSH